MKYLSTCDYCGRPRFQFCDTHDIMLYLGHTTDGDDVIVAYGIRPDCLEAQSIPINYCPFCGRKLGGGDDA